MLEIYFNLIRVFELSMGMPNDHHIEVILFKAFIPFKPRILL